MEGEEAVRKMSRPVSIVVFAIALLAIAAPAYGASGQWERAWGKDVISPGPGDTGSGFEICTVAANCKNGLNTTKLGGEFDIPSDVATDAAGNVYVTDALNNRIQKFDSNGNFLRLWGDDVVSTGPGNTGGFEICVAGVDTCKVGVQGSLGGELKNPRGIAVDSQGNVYVGDTQNSRIEKFDSNGNFLRAWGNNVINNGAGNVGFEICIAPADTCQTATASTGLGGEMSGGQGIAIDAADNVYVADEGNSERIQKFNSNGNFLRLWGKDVLMNGAGNTGFEICLGAASCKNGIPTTGLGGELNDPSRVAVDAANNVYVTDASSHRVQKFDASGNFLRLWGKNVVGPGISTDFEICTVATECQNGAVAGGPGGELQFPIGIATDASGAVYVTTNHRISKFDSSGNFLRLWGDNVVSAGPGNTGGFEICVAPADTCQTSGNSSPSIGGQTINPSGLATDAAGNLYVADQGNNRIQKFTPDPPPGTTITPGPSAFATATPSFTLTSNDPGSTFECSLDGGAFAACASPLTTSSLADGAHTLLVRATDPARQVDATPDSRAFTVDTTAPDTQIDSGPDAGSTTVDSTPSFGFSATEAGSTFECRIDTDAFAACSGPAAAHTTGPLTDGQHTFEVRATDALGNLDASPASRTFTVDAVPNVVPDTTAPETTIDQAPKDKLKVKKTATATYAFSSNEAGSTFLCTIDGKPPAPCASPLTLTKMKKGTHSFEVVAVDAAGNHDPSPATDTFKVKKKKHKHH
jgi:hypothetical protein